jgi:cellulose synthase/poly-beta-1,6-N-acetylglucosamine synthase-like glycosyltransferase
MTEREPVNQEFDRPPAAARGGDWSEPGVRQYLTAGQLDDRERFTSIDSTPPAYAVPRSARVAPTFLGAFGLIALGLLAVRPAVADLLEPWLTTIAGSAAPLAPLSYAVAAYFVAFYLAYALLASGSLLRRLRFALSLVVVFVLYALLIEVVARALLAPDNAELVEAVGNLLLAYGGMALLSVGILVSHRLPEPMTVRTRIRRSPRYGITLLFSVVVAAAVSMTLALLLASALDGFRDLALLGGILPGLVFFRLALNLQWYALARLDLRRRRRTADHAISVAFVVPAFNEEGNVGHCIASIDRAGELHAGVTRVYVVDNGSSDRTAEVARAVLGACQAVTGTVLECLQPGKSHALNLGLAAAEEDIVIRVDADTIVEPDVISRAVAHFADPVVGAVGGLPAPKDLTTVFAPLRLIEVLERIAFVRVATNAIDAVMVAPGTLAVYRRELLAELGGFATGINGEDADMAIRIGRLGYVVLADPAMVVRTEVPASTRSLREQRIRWSRSMYHVLAQNRSAFRMRQGPRGLAVLPWFVIHMPRQPMLIPLAIFAAAVVAIDPTLVPLHGGAAILAVLLGLQLLVTVGVLVMNRRIDLVQYLPDFVLFRILRSYFALEALFTLTLHPAVETAPQARPADPVAPMSQPDATSAPSA